MSLSYIMILAIVMMTILAGIVIYQSKTIRVKNKNEENETGKILGVNEMYIFLFIFLISIIYLMALSNEGVGYAPSDLDKFKTKNKNEEIIIRKIEKG